MKDANRTVSSTTAVTPATLWFPPYGVRYVFSLPLSATVPPTIILIENQVDKREDPYAPQQQGGCCVVM